MFQMRSDRTDTDGASVASSACTGTPFAILPSASPRFRGAIVAERARDDTCETLATERFKPARSRSRWRCAHTGSLARSQSVASAASRSRRDARTCIAPRY